MLDVEQGLRAQSVFRTGTLKSVGANRQAKLGFGERSLREAGEQR